jgi:hypothetical protein
MAVRLKAMLNRRFPLSGLFAVLLALMAQLGTGASVPRIDPVAVAGVLCHTEDDTGGTPTQTPGHPAGCPLCPLLCGTLHAQAVGLLLSGAPGLKPPAVLAAGRTGLPPPATAPPAPHRPPSQPRAPPVFS